MLHCYKFCVGSSAFNLLRRRKHTVNWLLGYKVNNVTSVPWSYSKIISRSVFKWSDVLICRESVKPFEGDVWLLTTGLTSPHLNAHIYRISSWERRIDPCGWTLKTPQPGLRVHQSQMILVLIMSLVNAGHQYNKKKKTVWQLTTRVSKQANTLAHELIIISKWAQTVDCLYKVHKS